MTRLPTVTTLPASEYPGSAGNDTEVLGSTLKLARSVPMLTADTRVATRTSSAFGPAISPVAARACPETSHSTLTLRYTRRPVEAALRRVIPQPAQKNRRVRLDPTTRLASRGPQRGWRRVSCSRARRKPAPPGSLRPEDVSALPMRDLIGRCRRASEAGCPFRSP